MPRVTQDRDLSQLSAAPVPSCPCLGFWGEGSEGRALPGSSWQGRRPGPALSPSAGSSRGKAASASFLTKRRLCHWRRVWAGPSRNPHTGWVSRDPTDLLKLVLGKSPPLRRARRAEEVQHSRSRPCQALAERP